MSAPEIVAMVAGLIAVLSAILGGLVWLVRAQISMQREFKPNGGSSFRDGLNRIQDDVRDIRNKVDDHIEWHLNDRK